MNIETRIERKRGCGYRQQGGMYLVSGGLAKVCYKLPIPLNICPTCGHGINPARGWTWVESDLILHISCNPPKEILKIPCNGMGNCYPFDDRGPDRFGLLWIQQGYKTTADFTRESIAMGVSRRIANNGIPRGFEIGVTWVLLAHRKAVDGKEPGIFQAFRPTAIEYVVHEDDSQEKLEKLEERGITLVKVKRDIDNQIEIPA